MRSRHLLLVFLASVFLFAMASQPAAGAEPAAKLIIPDVGPGMVEVDGDWQFRTGDDLGWADPAYDDSAWEHIKADDTWGAQTHPAYTGFAWYRRHLEITRSASGNQQLAILMPPVDDAYEIYWNGVKVGNLGTLPPHAVWYRGHRQSFGLPLAASEGSDGVLAFRVWKAPLTPFDLATNGGLNAPPRIGNSDAIAETIGNGDFQHLQASQFGRALNFFLLLMAATSFVAWIRNRDQKLFLWFALWLLAKVAYFCVLTDRVMYGISELALSISMLTIYSLGDCSIFLLLLYLFTLQENRRLLSWTRVMIATHVFFALAMGVVTLFLESEGPTLLWIDGTLNTIFFLSDFFVLVLTYQGLRRRLDLPRKLVAVMASLAYLYGTVTLLSVIGRRFTHWTLYGKMRAPIFHIFGAAVTTRQVLETALLLAVAYALMRYAMEQQRHIQAMEIELKSAQEVQQVLIPEALPEVAGYTIQSVYQPAQEVGGDFYQIISLPDDSTLVILGDVSGKGLKAAMNVALIVGTVRTLAEFNSSPAAVLNGLNRRLVGRLQGGFATTVVFKLSPSGDCILANAGHLPPFLNSSEMSLEPSLPLGIDANSDYFDRNVALHDEDRLTLYTDGVLEATNGEGELYGFERVAALLDDRPDAASIAATAQAFGQEDDITVLTITKRLVDHNVEAGSIVLAAG